MQAILEEKWILDSQDKDMIVMQHQFEYIHDEMGFNLRLSNINAAIGCAQLERLSSILKK